MRDELITLSIITACLFGVALAFGCGTGDEADDTDTSARGATLYQDAQTDQEGAPQEPARPDPQGMQVEIRVAGEGTMSGLQPECVLDGAAGAFEGEYAGEATIEDDGAYVAALASSTAQFFTPSGCLVPELEIAALTEVVVRASITATQPNCDAYCAAKARSEAEAECGATATSSTCRAAAGSEYQASCSIACSDGTDYRIVAETELSATAVAELSASQLSGLALGELSVDLTLDRIEDGQGQVVAEAQ